VERKALGEGGGCLLSKTNSGTVGKSNENTERSNDWNNGQVVYEGGEGEGVKERGKGSPA